MSKSYVSRRSVVNFFDIFMVHYSGTLKNHSNMKKAIEVARKKFAEEDL